MREKDALTKWCPMVRVTPSKYDMPPSAPIPRNNVDTHCIGSKCMMWRWLSGYTADHGYCGLAGFTTPRPKE